MTITLAPVIIFLLGMVMGVALIVIAASAVAKTTKKDEETKKQDLTKPVNDDLIKELFKEYLKETKNDK